MNVKAVRRFYDREAEAMREPGGIFEVTEERAAQIRAARPYALIEPVDATPAEPEPKKPAKRAAKKEG